MDDLIEREDEFFRALGSALERWQWVESAAYTVYSTFMSGANQRLVSVTFHHIQSFRSRIQLLDRCAYFVVPKGPMKERWDKIEKRMTNLTFLRNRLVHFTFSETHKEDEITLSLNPSHFNAVYAIRDRWKNPDNEIHLNELRKARQDFRELAEDLEAFWKDFASMDEKTASANSDRSEADNSEKPK